MHRLTVRTCLRRGRAGARNTPRCPRRSGGALLAQPVLDHGHGHGAERRRHDPPGSRGRREDGRSRPEGRGGGRAGRVCAAGLGDRAQLRHRGPGRLDHRRHGRLHARGDRDAGEARGQGRQEDQGRGHPPHPLALRGRYGGVARPRGRALGPRAPRPLPPGLHRRQRPRGNPHVARHRPVRCLPSAFGPGRLSQPARIHPGEVPRGVELPAAHEALRGRQGRRPRDRRRTRPGRAQPLGYLGQRRLLLSPAPATRDEFHGGPHHLQHLHAPGQPLTATR